MKAISVFLISLLSIGWAHDQSVPDSIQVTNANWHTTHISKQIVWQEAHFDSLFKSKQNVNLIVLKNRRRKPLVALASAGDSLKPTSWFGKRFNALVALNGTFFDTKKGGSVDLIKIDGRLIDTTRLSSKTLPEHQQSAIVIHRNRVRLVHGGNQPGWDRQLSDDNIITTGPLLLQNVIPHLLLKNAFNDNRHPLTCL